MPKIKIFILHDFIHQTRFGMEQFFNGETRLVSPEDAHYFCGQAWASLEQENIVNDETSIETVLLVNDVHTRISKSDL